MGEPPTDIAAQVEAAGETAAGEVVEPGAIGSTSAGGSVDPPSRSGPGAGATAGGGKSPISASRSERAMPPDNPLACLPVYARSLLKIRVPVQVRLASKRQSIGEIVNLCPGSIITFPKTCDEVLELKAGGCDIAVGEAVKVGDKFGLRISSMTLPLERFQPVRPRD